MLEPPPDTLSDNTNRLVIITNGNYFARLILEGVLETYQGAITGVMIVTGDYKGRTGFKALWELGKVIAWPYLGYKILSYLFFKLAQRFYPLAELSVKQQAERRKIPYVEFPSVKSIEAIAWIRARQPDLIISVSCPQMIGKEILSCARLGGINIHSSLLPSYAGLAPYFWVLSNGEAKTGTTVHYMTLKFDVGNILVQRTATIEPNESAFHLFARLSKTGCEALQEAVGLALNENSGWPQDSKQYSYFSNPTNSSYKRLRRNHHCLLRMSELLAAICSEVRSI